MPQRTTKKHVNLSICDQSVEFAEKGFIKKPNPRPLKPDYIGKPLEFEGCASGTP